MLCMTYIFYFTGLPKVIVFHTFCLWLFVAIEFDLGCYYTPIEAIRNMCPGDLKRGGILFKKKSFLYHLPKGLGCSLSKDGPWVYDGSHHVPSDSVTAPLHPCCLFGGRLPTSPQISQLVC